MRFDERDIERVREGADIRDFIPGLSGRGATQYVQCPECKKEGKGKGLCVTHRGRKNLAKCFSCGFSLADAIAAEQYYGRCSFPEAVERVATQSGIHIESHERRREKSIAHGDRKIAKSFCQSQLEASGLTVKDITATIDERGEQMYVQTFRRGSIDRQGRVNESDDEMLIYYYDLQGKQMTYSRRGAGNKLQPYIRIRWSNPAAHLDMDGREIKYQSPAGAPTRLYIPQYIRSKYQREEPIDTLIIQEGEKKAEKACKHGIASVGIQGIFNIGNEESGLIQDVQYIVQRCRVKNVVLLFDSDWNHLSRSLQVGSHVDERPNAFAKAAIKFKAYIQTLHGIGVSADIHFGHISENERGDKGIDDLLTNTLRGKEDALLEDITATLLTHDGKGRYVDIHKITSKTDNQIKDYWGLNDRQAFFDTHREELLKLPGFRFAKMAYRVEDGKILQASKTAEREFWSVETSDDGKGKKSVEFDTYEAIKFVVENGYYRVHSIDMDVDQYRFVRIDDGVVHHSGQTEIRDFVYSYIMQSTKDPLVLKYFTSQLGRLLSLDKLERLSLVEDNFDRFEPNVQRMYYLNGQVEATSSGVIFSEKILGQVWVDKVINRKFKRVPIISDIYVEDGCYVIEATQESLGCEFWQFIQNTCNFGAKEGGKEDSQNDRDYLTHLVNKITTIGFLLTDYKYQTEQKAVIAMDAHQGEVSQSNGRTGKSLVGKALSYMMRQTYIDGRKMSNDDQFLYSSVTPRTRNVFIDDVRVNFDFGAFFGAITGNMCVNPKHGTRFEIKNEVSPKIYITTNHAINEQSRSAKDRIAYMAFSDHYNDNHSPYDEFKHNLFTDWDEAQWNLFDNFMIECVEYYLKSMSEGWYRAGKGAVPPPMGDLDRRTQRQIMGEAFFQWAEGYFDKDSGNLNNKIARKVMYDAYHGSFNGKFTVNPSLFREKVVSYCRFKGYHFNVSRPNREGVSYSDFAKAHPRETFVGDSDKSCGVEYFTVFTKEVADCQPF